MAYNSLIQEEIKNNFPVKSSNWQGVQNIIYSTSVKLNSKVF